MAAIITGFGVFLYLLAAAFNVYMNAVSSPILHGRLVMTIPTDTALGLLGVTATVLVAFVASLWTSAQLPATGESAYGRGRRLVTIDVTMATGAGSVFVGVAGALHDWGRQVNVIVSLAVVGLSVALAYIAAEIGEFIRRDRHLNQTLSQFVQQGKLSRMQNARQCWESRSRLAGRRRPQRSLLARLRQNLGWVVVFAALQGAALLAWSSDALAPNLAVTVGCAAWSLIVWQLIVHHAAAVFVQRNWSALLLVSLISLLATAVNASLAVTLTVALRRDVGMPAAAADALSWSTLFGPLLLCLAGLTVAPTSWRRYRPLPEVRWGVMRAMSRHIDKLSRDDSDEPSGARLGWHSAALRRLRTAIRTATGVEPLAADSAP
ncbi:MAG: hypothetical protein ABI047_11120 [Jatrophihabitantaceae bacterium]